MEIDRFRMAFSHATIVFYQKKLNQDTIIEFEDKNYNGFIIKSSLFFKNSIVECINFESEQLIRIPKFIIKFVLTSKNLSEFTLTSHTAIKFDIKNTSIKQEKNELRVLSDGVASIYNMFESVLDSIKGVNDAYHENPYNWICINLPSKKSSLHACLGVSKENSFLRFEDLSKFSERCEVSKIENSIFVLNGVNQEIIVLDPLEKRNNSFRGMRFGVSQGQLFSEFLVNIYRKEEVQNYGNPHSEKDDSEPHSFNDQMLENRFGKIYKEASSIEYDIE